MKRFSRKGQGDLHNNKSGQEEHNKFKRSEEQPNILCSHKVHKRLFIIYLDMNDGTFDTI